jgi:outer membrane receptor protein involved in Fe transport
MRLVSNADGPLLWTAGGAIQNSDTYRDGQVATAAADGYIAFDGNGDARDRIFARRNDDTFDQYSFFGDASHEIVRDIRARIGLRWFHSKRTDQQTIVQAVRPGQPIGDQPFQDFDQSLLAKSFQLSWQATPAALFYIQAAEGFRAGGPNFPGGFTISAPPYDADSVWNYEAGWKLGFLDRRVNWNGAIFRIDWDDLQVLVPTELFSYITNAGQARSEGFETELDAALDEHWSLAFGATYNDARLVGRQPYSISQAAQLHAGDRLANVPEWTANASILYRQALGAGYTGSARADVVHQSSRGSMVPDQNPAYFRAAGYELVDLHLDLDHTDGWGLSLDIENLFNRYAEISTRVLDANLAQTVSTARPRTYSLGVSWKY